MEEIAEKEEEDSNKSKGEEEKETGKSEFEAVSGDGRIHFCSLWETFH